MRIYYIFLISLFVLSALTINIKNIKVRNIIIIGFAAIYIIMMQGLRHQSIGTDVHGYINGYNLSANINVFEGEKLFNYEPGYILINHILNKLGISEQLFLTIISLIIIAPISTIMIKKSKMPALSILLYMAFGFLTMTFSGLRQSIAMGILFFSYLYIQDKKVIKFLMCILVACTFHKSAIGFIVAYPIYNLNIKVKDYIFIIPIFLIAFVFRQQIFGYIAFLFRGESVGLQATGAYGLFLFMISTLILSYLFYKKDNKDVNAYRNYILVSIFIQMLASYSNLVGRMGYYYWIFVTLLVPEILKNQKVGLDRFLYGTIIITFLVLYYINNLSTGYLNIIPYRFFWQ